MSRGYKSVGRGGEGCPVTIMCLLSPSMSPFEYLRNRWACYHADFCDLKRCIEPDVKKTVMILHTSGGNGAFCFIPLFQICYYFSVLQ